MKWSIGIVTDGKQRERVDQIIASIEANNIPSDKHEIFVIGGENNQHQCKSCICHNIPFDENIKKAWITAKKNLISRLSKFENLLIVHDYVSLHPDWYGGFLKFNDEVWDVCMCKIANKDGRRHRDWTGWLSNGNNGPVEFFPYDDPNRTNQMYISGAVLMVKKQWLLHNPLDESKSWGQSEDVSFSLNCRNRWRYKMNQHSILQYLKQQHQYPETDQIICKPI